MKKSLLVLLVLIIGACTIIPEEEEKPTPPTFGETAQGIYEIDGQELELKADGHFYNGETIVYTMVEDRGEGNAIYSVDIILPSSVMRITKYLGLSIKVTEDTKTLTIFKKSSTEYWGSLSDISFDVEFSQGESGSIPEGGGEDKPLDPAEAKVFINKVNNGNLYNFVDSTLTKIPTMTVDSTIPLIINGVSKEFKLAHLRNATDAIFTNGIDTDITYVGITFRKNTLDQQSKKDRNKGYTKDNISWSQTTGSTLAVVNDATEDQKSMFAKTINDKGLKTVDDNGVFIDFKITPEGTFDLKLRPTPEDTVVDTYTVVSIINDTTALVLNEGKDGILYSAQVELRGNEFGFDDSSADTIFAEEFYIIAFVPNATEDQKKAFAIKVNAVGLSTEKDGNIVDFTMDKDGSFFENSEPFILINIISDTKVQYASPRGTTTFELRGDEFGHVFTDDGVEAFFVSAFVQSTPDQKKAFAIKVNAVALSTQIDGNIVDFVIAPDGTYSANRFGSTTTTYKIGKVIDDNTVLVSFSDGFSEGLETHRLVGTSFNVIYYDGTIGETIAFKKATSEQIKSFADKIKAERLVFSKDGDFVDFVIAPDGTYSSFIGNITTTYKIGKVIDANTVLVSFSDGFNKGQETHRLIGTSFNVIYDDGDPTGETIAFKKATPEQIKIFAIKVNAVRLSIEKDGNIVDFVIALDGTYSARKVGGSFITTYKIGKVIDANTVLVSFVDSNGNKGQETHRLIGTSFNVIYSNYNGDTIGETIAFKKATSEQIKSFANKIKAERLVFSKDGDFVDFVIDTIDGTYSSFIGNITTTYKIGKVIDANTVLVSFSDGFDNGQETHRLLDTSFNVIYNDGNSIGKTIAFKKATSEQIKSFANKIKAERLVFSKDGDFVDFVIDTIDGTYSVDRSGSITTYKIGKVIDANTVLVSFIDSNGNKGQQTHRLLDTSFNVIYDDGVTIGETIAFKKSDPDVISAFASKVNVVGLSTQIDGNIVNFVIDTIDGTYSVDRSGSITTYKIGKVIDANTVLVSFIDSNGNKGQETHRLLDTSFNVIYGDTIGEIIAEKTTALLRR